MLHLPGSCKKVSAQLSVLHSHTTARTHTPPKGKAAFSPQIRTPRYGEARTHHERVAVGGEQAGAVAGAQPGHGSVVRGPYQAVHVGVAAGHGGGGAHGVVAQDVDGVVQPLQAVLDAALLWGHTEREEHQQAPGTGRCPACVGRHGQPVLPSQPLALYFSRFGPFGSFWFLFLFSVSLR